jgi:hypothetical protein
MPHFIHDYGGLGYYKRRNLDSESTMTVKRLLWELQVLLDQRKITLDSEVALSDGINWVKVITGVEVDKEELRDNNSVYILHE